MIERRLVSRPVSSLGGIVAPRRTTTAAPDYERAGLVLNLDAGDVYSYPNSGTTWTSRHSNTVDHNCVLTNGPAYVRDGSGAIDFDGTNDYGTVNNSLNGDYDFGTVSGNANDFAMEVVVMHDGTGSLQNYIRPHAGGTTRAQMFRAYQMRPNWAYWNASNVIQCDIWAPTALEAGRWYHIMATRVGGIHTIYINGVADAEYVNANAQAVNPVTAMAIGRYPFGTPGSEFLNGKIAVARIYKGMTFDAAAVYRNYRAVKDRFGLPDTKPGIDIVTSGLVGYWDAGNSASYPGNGTTWTDLSGNGNNATLVNSPTYNKDFGGAFTTNGTNSYISINDSSSLDSTSSVTVMVWCRFKSFPTNYATLWAKRTQNGTAANYGINIRGGATNVYQVYYTSPTGTFRVLSGNLTQTFSTNVWCSVAAVFEQSGTSTIVRLYKDGALVAESTLSGNLQANTAPFRLGQYGTWEYLNCEYGSVQVYNRALSESEILTNFNASAGRYSASVSLVGPQIVTSGLVGHWDAGNSASYPGTGTTWTDLTGNSNGTLTNGPTYTADNGGTIVLDGTNDFVEIPHVSAFNVGTALTLESVFYWDGINTSGLIFGKRDPSSPYKQFALYVSNVSANGSGNYVGIYSFTGSGQAIRWARWQMPGAGIYHVVGVANLSAISVYVNGVLRETITQTVGSDFNTTRRMTIGLADGLNAYHKANVYQARIYNRVLTAAEIAQNYNAIRGRFGL